jgi:hypothetical protein
MKNKQKTLLSRRAISSIFAIVAVVTLSGYGLEPVSTKAVDMRFSIENDPWTVPSKSLISTASNSKEASGESKKKAANSAPAPTKKNIRKTVTSANAFPLETLATSDPVVNNQAGPLVPEFTDEEKAAKIRSYFGKYNLPLADNAEKFVEVSHYCDIDWALLPAIAMQESTGGKFAVRSNNPFGWASAQIKFNNFDEAIEVVGGHLCGLYDSTDQYYKDKTTLQKLWHYNGSVNARYPGEVVAIMSAIKATPLVTPIAMK